MHDQLTDDLALTVMRFARYLRCHGTTEVPLAQLAALSTLAAAGPLTLGQLAAQENVRPPTMTRTVEALSRLHLVQKRPHPRDRRQAVVEVTSAGEQLLKVESGARARWLRAELAPLPNADREILVAAVQILGRLIRAGEPVGGPQ